MNSGSCCSSLLSVCAFVVYCLTGAVFHRPCALSANDWFIWSADKRQQTVRAQQAGVGGNQNGCLCKYVSGLSSLIQQSSNVNFKCFWCSLNFLHVLHMWSLRSKEKSVVLIDFIQHALFSGCVGCCLLVAVCACANKFSEVAWFLLGFFPVLTAHELVWCTERSSSTV